MGRDATQDRIIRSSCPPGRPGNSYRRKPESDQCLAGRGFKIDSGSAEPESVKSRGSSVKLVAAAVSKVTGDRIPWSSLDEPGKRRFPRPLETVLESRQ